MIIGQTLYVIEESRNGKKMKLFGKKCLYFCTLTLNPTIVLTFFSRMFHLCRFFLPLQQKLTIAFAVNFRGHYFFQTTLGPLSTTPATSKFEMCQMYLRSFAVQNQFLRSFIRVTKRVAFKKQIQMSKLQKEYGSVMKLNLTLIVMRQDTFHPLVLF